MKLYEKLENMAVIDDHKDFLDLISIRAIKVNDFLIDDPRYEIKENDKIKVGIKILD